MNALAVIAALALSVAGFVALALSLERHHAHLHGRGSVPAPAAVLRRRAAGALALGLAWSVHIGADGWPLGTVSWLGTLTASAFAVVLGLSYAPRMVQRLLPGVAGVGVAALAGARLFAG